MMMTESPGAFRNVVEIGWWPRATYNVNVYHADSFPCLLKVSMCQDWRYNARGQMEGVEEAACLTSSVAACHHM